MTNSSFERVVELDDGRTVVVRRASPLSPWDVQVVGEEQHVPEDPWLLAALADRLAPDRAGRAPDYVFALMDELLGVDTAVGRRYPCPCCDLLTLTEVDMEQICPVCRWQDNVGQKWHPYSDGGANKPSLEQARDNYASLGTSDPRKPVQGRPARPEEIPPAR